MWKIMKTFFAARCDMALPLQDRKYLVSLDRFIAWSPLVFRPGRARPRTPLTHSQTGPWSGSTNQNWQGGRPAWDQDKSDSDPDVDPDSRRCACVCLDWAGLGCCRLGAERKWVHQIARWQKGCNLHSRKVSRGQVKTMRQGSNGEGRAKV